MSTADVIEAVLAAGLRLPPGTYQPERPMSVPSATVPLASRAAEDELLELARAHCTVDKDEPTVATGKVDAAATLEDGGHVTGQDTRPVGRQQPRQDGQSDGDPHRVDGTPRGRDLFDQWGRIPRTWQQDH